MTRRAWRPAHALNRQQFIRGENAMATVEKTIEVDVPVSRVYNQWTQFEEFPRFMEGIKEVTQVDDRHLRWCAEVGGKEERWEAEITSQIPDEKIAWRSISGIQNNGIVTFTDVDGAHTQVHLRIEYKTEGMVEAIGDMFGAVDRTVEGSLERFKSFIESRDGATGEWRGLIHSGEVKDEASREHPSNMAKRAWAEEMRIEGRDVARAEGGDKRAMTGPPSQAPGSADDPDQRLTTP
jgi:uncharacterized membrane protein